jgi:coenzyme F420-reducing hydrogenase alpha subunit
VNASQTLEKAMNIQIPETARVLREMLVLSQLVDSHSLSFVVLSLPDLIPKERHSSVVDIKSAHPDLFEKGITLHTLGRKMTSLLGGRNVHPANVRLGGMCSNPLLDSDFDFQATIGESLEIALVFLDAAKGWLTEQEDAVKSVGVIDSNFMSLSNKGTVSFVDGQVRCVGADGSDLYQFDSNDYMDYLSESIEPHTYMKLPYFTPLGVDDGVLRVNCLARANVNAGYGTPKADQELNELRNKWGQPLKASLLSHWVRLIETVYALERVHALLKTPVAQKAETAVDAETKDGEAVGCLEAPRGTLFHHYALKDGRLTKANLMVATQNNALAVNKALSQTLRDDKQNGLSEEEIIHRCEMVIRSYDPCISCSTHITRTKEE